MDEPVRRVTAKADMAEIGPDEQAKMAELVAGADGARMATEEPKPRKRGRDHIPVDTLILRLVADVEGTQPLSMGQRKSIELMLNKSLPNLQATQLSGDPDGEPIRTEEVRRVIVDPHGAGVSPVPESGAV